MSVLYATLTVSATVVLFCSCTSVPTGDDCFALATRLEPKGVEVVNCTLVPAPELHHEFPKVHYAYIEVVVTPGSRSSARDVLVRWRSSPEIAALRDAWVAPSISPEVFIERTEGDLLYGAPLWWVRRLHFVPFSVGATGWFPDAVDNSGLIDITGNDRRLFIRAVAPRPRGE